MGGGRGYRYSDGATLVLLDNILEASDALSLLSSDLGGVGGSCGEVSGNSVPGLCAKGSVKGKDGNAISVDMFWNVV